MLQARLWTPGRVARFLVDRLWLPEVVVREGEVEAPPSYKGPGFYYKAGSDYLEAIVPLEEAGRLGVAREPTTITVGGIEVEVVAKKYSDDGGEYLVLAYRIPLEGLDEEKLLDLLRRLSLA